MATATYVDRLIDSRQHVGQGVRAACGVIRLSGRHGVAALEKACERALAAGVLSPRFVEGLLKAAARPVLPDAIDGEHGNVRGIIIEDHMLHQTIEKLHALKLSAMACSPRAGSRGSRPSASRSAWRCWWMSSTRPPTTRRWASG